MDILVTGATGFIGSHLCRALAEAGHRVRALHRPSSSLAELEGVELERVAGDVLDPPSLARACDGVEILFHLAGQVGNWEVEAGMIRSHLEGTRNVLRSAQAAGVRRVIHTSSVAALGIPPRRPVGPGGPPLIDERQAWNATRSAWPYGYAKHRAEQEVLEAVGRGLDAAIVNPSLVFGPGDPRRGTGAFVARMARGRVPLVNPPGGLNAVHIDDVVRGHLAALTHARTGERYILGGENLTIAQLLKTLAEVVGRPPPRFAVPRGLLLAVAAVSEPLLRLLRLPVRGSVLRLAGHYFYYDLRKSRSAFDLPEPQPFRLAAEAAFASYREREAAAPRR